MDTNTSSKWTPAELLEVAKWLRFICWMILANVIVVLITLYSTFTTASAQHKTSAMLALFNICSMAIRLIIGVFTLYGVYKLASALRFSAIVCAVLALLPCISLIVLLVFNDKSVKLLKDNGLKVGLLGAKEESIRYLESQINS